MRHLPRRVAALLVALAVLGGHPALCRMAAPIPQGRMACCPPDASCPMHAAPGTADAATAAAPAPDCCTASPARPADTGLDSPVPLSSIDLPGLSGAPAGAPAAVRRSAPPAGAYLPPLRRHALLSVYLL